MIKFKYWLGVYLIDQDGWREDIDRGIKRYKAQDDYVESDESKANIKAFKQYKVYYVSQQVQDKFDLFKHKGPADFRIFSHIKGQAVFMLNEAEVYKLSVLGDMLYLMYHDASVKGSEILHEYELNLKTNVLNSIRHVDNFSEQEQAYALFIMLRILSFVYLVDVEEIVLSPNTKTSPKRVVQAQNNSSREVIIISKDWNVKYKVGAHGVQGYFAIRHTGPGRTVPRLTWVKDYEKDEYTVEAKSGKNEIQSSKTQKPD